DCRSVLRRGVIGSLQPFEGLRSWIEARRRNDGSRHGYPAAPRARRVRSSPRSCVSPTRPAAVLVLAAGEGTRMPSSVPKVLHRIAGRSLVGHAVATARGLGPEHLVVVVRHGRAAVVAHLAEVAPDVRTADQDEVPGTGRAVQCGLAVLPPLSGTVVVTYGDCPLLGILTLRRLVEVHEREGDAVTLLSHRPPDPSGLGRVVRDARGTVAAI